ncbi:MAG: hypothetical protein GX075_00430 [Firmicutes bacterium]|nr:hypothetical protein [Bacillota bacterium]
MFADDVINNDLLGDEANLQESETFEQSEAEVAEAPDLDAVEETAAEAPAETEETE